MKIGLETFHREFGAVVRRERERRELAQCVLADTLGVSQPTVSKLEAGVTGLTLSMLLGVSEAFEIAPSTLVKRVESAVRRTRGASGLGA